MFEIERETQSRNKKVFQPKANCPPTDRRMGYIVNKFENVQVGIPVWWGLNMSRGAGVRGSLYDEKGVWGPAWGLLHEQNDRYTRLKTLPSHNFIGGK